jgi:hypothetical protein
MDDSLRLKALKRLARSESDKAQTALSNELEKIRTALSEETRYDILETQRLFLEAIMYRLHGPSLDIILEFIERLKDMQLTYHEGSAFDLDSLAKFQNNATLTAKSAQLLANLRYLETPGVFDALIDLSKSADEEVRKQALGGLERLAAFDIFIFYGTDGKTGIGSTPQKIIIEKLERFDDVLLEANSTAVESLCGALLSPSMEGTSSNYRELTIHSRAVPASDEVKDVRKRAVELLKKLYGLAGDIQKKISILNSLGSASSTPHTADYGAEIDQMIASDTIVVLSFFESLVPEEPLQIVQKIEHDAFWDFYNTRNQIVEKACRQIENALERHSEYQIYRDLVGFEGVFGNWRDLKEAREPFSEIQERRKERASNYVSEISEENFSEWRERILKYTKTESEDLATFPIFFEFLFELANTKPALALQLVSSEHDKIQRFLIPLLRGLWKSEEREIIHGLITSWISEGTYLQQCVKIFLDEEIFDKEILLATMDRAIADEDAVSLSMVVSVAASKYNADDEFLVKGLFLPAIQALTGLSVTYWVNEVWFRPERKHLLGDLETSDADIVLENLVEMPRVDFHGEEILYQIANRYPMKVVAFFKARVSVAEEKRKSAFDRYEAIPFEFHKLAEPLSEIAGDIVSEVRSWFEGNYGMFIYREARLLKIIFPEFSNEFEGALLELAASTDEEDARFVLAVLRNYEGQPFIHKVCKSLVRSLPENHRLLNEVMAALESTGVMSGEYGYAVALEKKAEEVNDWLDDANAKVKSFAVSYIDQLKHVSEAERKRAAEGIELRKHEFGEPAKRE